ncbi:hypothetical protein [Sphingomonas sp. NFR15]|uniref:hypothetical protein n=1 Tax=Sphingomonas sp. NFR15 TaxID=1566282 RepID=UPI0008831FE8|nr:hypothetical protein [Sphingomonas sp. NFR15]SDA16109.1 hypothetical protein SAMN03159340_00812 [Sphingomonas sp. NFR15]
MFVFAIACIFASVLIGLSVWANARFRPHERLPMQWSLAGTVNWTAPRVLALSFTPALAAVTLGFIALLALNVAPRVGQEGIVLPVTMLIGASFVGMHLLHFWLIENSLKRNDG